MIAAIDTQLTNTRSEGYNRVAKHIGRIAFGFRNPDNQRRRIRWAAPAETGQCHPGSERYGLRQAAATFGVELVAVEISTELRMMILRAQRRQIMVNADQIADDLDME